MARILIPTVLLIWILVPDSWGRSQFGDPREFQRGGPDMQREAERTQYWRVGIEVEAVRGPCFV